MFYKILDADLKDGDFKHSLGLNVDPNPFKLTDKHTTGDLYYTTLEHIAEFLVRGHYLAEVRDSS